MLVVLLGLPAVANLIPADPGGISPLQDLEPVCSLARHSGSQCVLLGQRIPVNRARPQDLTVIPGIGPALAGRIVSTRMELGGFGTLDELVQVRGIGPAKLAELKRYLTIESPENRADAP